jgi:hypothetical protein
MQLRKTYKNINPELLYDEMQDFILKQGATLGERKLETYSLPGGSSHISRATLTFKMPTQGGKAEKECIRVHIVGSAVGETKMELDIDEKLFLPANKSALEEDLDFIFGSYEVRQ